MIYLLTVLGLSAFFHLLIFAAAYASRQSYAVSKMSFLERLAYARDTKSQEECDQSYIRARRILWIGTILGTVAGFLLGFFSW